MNKRKLAKIIGVCTIAIMIIVVITILPSCESSPTPPAYGLEFDGEDDYVNCGGNESLNLTNEKTIELWVKFSTVLASNHTVGLVTYKSYYLLVYSGQYGIIFQDKQLDTRVNIGTSALNFTADTWYHIAVTSTADTVTNQKVYVDGEEVVGTYEWGWGGPTINKLAIGGRSSDTTDWFDGIISEVRIWNTARTESEIQADMYKELVGTEEGLVGYWKFNEGLGTIAHDSSVNDNHGTLVGGPVWFGGGG